VATTRPGAAQGRGWSSTDDDGGVAAAESSGDNAAFDRGAVKHIERIQGGSPSSAGGMKSFIANS
jgi:hypothetical protein